jgi:hypothetical protein
MICTLRGTARVVPARDRHRRLRDRRRLAVARGRQQEVVAVADGALLGMLLADLGM